MAENAEGALPITLYVVWGEPVIIAKPGEWSYGPLAGPCETTQVSDDVKPDHTVGG